MEQQNHVFGLPSKPRYAEPSMADILSWTTYSNQVQLNTDREIQENPVQQFHQQQLSPEFQDIKNHKIEQSSQQIQQRTSQNKQNELLNGLNQHPDVLKRSNLYPRQIKNEIYMVQPVYLKASRAQSALQRPQTAQKPKKKIPKEQIYQQQISQEQIKNRQAKIKQFALLTRDLPNSAFTTYFGKPAFEAYGRGSSKSQLKSHNVMPHRGKNQPTIPQTHYSALLKGRNIQVSNHVPRKPIDEGKQTQKNSDIEQMINLPLKKPDLIHSQRFATHRPVSAQSSKIPKQNLKKPNQPFKPKDNLVVQKNNKSTTKHKPKQKLKSTKTITNERENLIDLLEEKKTNASKLAYKVTQCYPLLYEGLTNSVLEPTLMQRPAGIKSKIEDKVGDLIKMKCAIA